MSRSSQPMRILHLPVAYQPWTIGGREVYTHTLCQALSALGVESEVAIHQDPAVGEPLGRHLFGTVPVHVLPPLDYSSRRRSMYTRRFPALPGFEELLTAIQPDVVHFHDQNGGASVSHLQRVKARGIPAVVTCHSPGQTCPQTELLRGGQVPCDGTVLPFRCTACRLQASGMSRWAARSAALAEWPGIDASSPSRLARVLTARKMTRLFRESLGEFIQLADVVVVLAEWSREVWRRNGCPEAKLRLVRTGGPDRPALAPQNRPPRDRLRIAALGRCDRTKGFHVLVEAVKSRPDLPVEINWIGPYWDSAYGLVLREAMGTDPRFLPPRMVPNTQVIPTLAEMDLLVIPSIWLETGPLVLFDAFAAGIPVVASQLGGLAEVVRDGIDGRLFPAGNATALADVLSELAHHPQALQALRRRPGEPPRPWRTFRQVAEQMKSVYSELAARTGDR